jgi:hypothetical protein
LQLPVGKAAVPALFFSLQKASTLPEKIALRYVKAKKQYVRGCISQKTAGFAAFEIPVCY